MYCSETTVLIKQIQAQLEVDTWSGQVGQDYKRVKSEGQLRLGSLEIKLEKRGWTCAEEGLRMYWTKDVGYGVAR